METNWEKIKIAISNGYRTVSEKTGEMTQIGRLKLEMIAVKRDIEKSFIELGGRVYHAFEKKQTDKILSEENLLSLIKMIRTKQSELRELEKRIKQIRDQHPAKDIV